MDTVNDEEILNATFTIDDNEKHSNSKKMNSFFLDKNISSSTSSSSASPPSMSVLSEHLEKIQNQSKSKRSASIRKSKNEFSEESNKGVRRSGGDIFLEESSIQSELNTLNEERKKLALEKRYFYEQKIKLEEQSDSIRQVSTDFIKQVGNYF